jgi:hypothetical protein
MTLIVPVTLMSIRRFASSGGTCQSGAGLFMMAALLMRRSGASPKPSTLAAQIPTFTGSATSATSKLCGAP